jgi:hypothetical protein
MFLLRAATDSPVVGGIISERWAASPGFRTLNRRCNEVRADCKTVCRSPRPSIRSRCWYGHARIPLELNTYFNRSMQRPERIVI